MSARPETLALLRLPGACATSLHMPTPQDLARLRAETMLDARTIAKAYAGRVVIPSAHAAVRRAATQLGLTPPPPLVTTPRKRAVSGQ